MSFSRRQFLKNAGIGTAAVVGGASLLKTNSAFAVLPPMPATSDVSFIGGTSTYVSPNNGKTGRRGMIYDVMLPFQAEITAGIAGKTNVIIKANLVYGSSANTVAILTATHVDAIRGMIDFLRMINPTLPIIVAEASATSTANMMKWCSYPQLYTDFTGVTLVDLNNNVVVNSSGANGAASIFPAVTRHIWKTDLTSTVPINATSAFLDKNNYVISFCRPKTHNTMVMTATVKNMGMGMPLTSSSSAQSQNSKSLMHSVSSTSGTTAGEDKAIAYNIFQNATQMLQYGIPNFAVLDAWEGMQGDGPTNGTSIMQYCAAAGPDFLAVDRLSAVLMGFSDTPVAHQVAPYNTPSYTDMRVLVWMSNAGLGNYDLSKIHFRAGTLANLRTFTLSYVMSPNYLGTQTSGTKNSWETAWADSTNDSVGPTTVLDSQLHHDSTVVGVHSHGDPLDPKPYMHPQANMHTGGVVTGNEVKIDLALPYGQAISLAIFNLQGREVRRLGNEYLNAGRYTIAWDCRDSHGARVPNGNYIIRLQFGGRQLSDRISLLR